VNEQLHRDKASLDIFWLRDESLEESDNLPRSRRSCPGNRADLEAALEQFRKIAMDLGGEDVGVSRGSSPLLALLKVGQDIGYSTPA